MTTDVQPRGAPVEGVVAAAGRIIEGVVGAGALRSASFPRLLVGFATEERRG